MTEQRQRADSDPLVSRTYRDLADDKPSPDTDASILSRARAASRPRYARLRIWTRPLAWAATVGLSLVIVLQLSQAPEGEPARTTTGPEIVPPDVDMIGQAEEMARLQIGEQLRPESREAQSARQFCTDEERADAETWLSCIGQLEKDGRVDDATHEREAFELAFPEHDALR